MVSEKYPIECVEGMDLSCLVNHERNNVLAEKYRKLSKKEKKILLSMSVSDSTSIMK